jgi:phage tail-like protein
VPGYDYLIGDAVAANSFKCYVDKKAIPVKEVSGLKQEIDMIEVKTQSITGEYFLKKIPGKPKAVTLTITRALTADPTFVEWMKSVETGKPDRRPVVIEVFGPGDPSPQHTYTVINCQPSSIELTQVSAGATNAIDEKVTLQGERVTIA